MPDAPAAPAAGPPVSPRELAWRRLLFAHAPDALFVLDGDGHLLEANAAFARLLGRSLADAMALRLWDWDVDLPEPRARALLQRDAPEEATFESRWRCADGQLRLVETRIHRLGDASGPLIVGSSRDITGRRTDEQALRTTEQRLKLVMANAGMGAWDWDIAQRRLSASPEVWALLGHQPSGGTGMQLEMAQIIQALHPDDHALVREAARRTLEDRQPLAVEFRYLRPGGQAMWLAGTGVLQQDEAGRPLRLVGALQDITQRRQAESALRASEARLAVALQASGAGVWEWDLDRTEIHFSREVCDILRLAPPGPDGGLVGFARLADRLSPSGLQALMAATRQALESDGEFAVELQVLDPEHGHRWVEDRGRLVRDAQGQPLRMVGTVRDVTAQREAQALLAREAARRRELFEQSRDGILVVDACGLVLEANPAMAAMLGRPLADLPGMGVRELGVALPETDLMGALASAPAQRISFDVAIAAPDGAALQLEVSASAVLADGQQLVFAVCRDVTQRKRAEAALRESEARHRATFENSAVGMAEHALDGRWLNVNPRLCEITGYSRAALMALDFRQLTHPDDRRDEWPQLRRLLRGELPTTRREKRYLRQDGRTIWVAVSSSLVRGADRGGRYFVTVVEDITERVRIEAELARHRQHLEAEVAERTQALQQAMRARSEGEHFLRSIADNIPDMVGYWDAQRVLRFANRPYRDWFAPGQDPVGRTRADFFGDPDTDTGEQAFAAALAGQAQRFEYVLTNALGEVRYAWVHYIPDRQGDQVAGLFVLVSDISEVKQVELRLQALNEQLVAARDRAEAANRAKSAFLANISHEIRTPMNAIIGLTHLMQRDAGSGPVAERLGKVSDAAHHLLDVINDVLDLSKIESGKLQLEQTDFPIDAVLARACALVAERARAKGLELVLKSEGVPSLLRGDPTRVSQALLNLMSNAVKFTDRGSVVLRCELMGADADALRLRFSVRDTGVGVPADKIHDLFNAFEQADTSTTRRFGGTGLGLAITRRLALLMGGDVGVHTVQGQGSCFWFTANFERATQPAQADNARLPGRRVLVADDLPDARAAMADLLRRMGMQVDSVASGDEAVQAALLAEQRRRPYELLLLDADMPGTGGAAALQQLHDRLGAQGTPPCVLIVDDERAQAEPPGQDVAALVHLVKPVTLSALSACIDRLDRQPWQRVAPDQGEPPPHERALQLRAAGQRVLLAEDNPINQEVASELLRAVGMQVDLAADGHEAVQLAAQHAYDLVLMDMQMPVMDGLAATRALRAMPGHARTPILAMTANAFGDDRRACLDAGMDDHIAKPVDPELLYAMLGRWLPARVVDSQPGPAAPAPASTAPPRPAPAAPAVPATPAATPAVAPAAPGPDFSGIAGLTMSRALLYLPGRDQVYARVLRQFSDNYALGVPGLDAALLAGDWPAAQRLLHALRGACGAVGATAVQAEAQALELQIKALGAAGMPASLQPDAVAVHTSLASLVAALRERLALAEPPAPPPAPAAGAASPGAHPPAVAAALQSLVVQLRQADFQAGESFRRLEPALRATLGAQAVQRLAGPLRQHDYAAALREAEALLGRLPAAAHQ
jgi:PAS domain S-box-containing protein